MLPFHKNRKLRFLNVLCRYCSRLFTAKGKRPKKGKPAMAKRGPSKTPSICNLKDRYYTAKELSKILNLTMGALAQYRRRGTGPQCIRVGYRSYRYPREGILKFIEEQTRASPSANRNDGLHPKKKG